MLRLHTDPRRIHRVDPCFRIKLIGKIDIRATVQQIAQIQSRALEVDGVTVAYITAPPIVMKMEEMKKNGM